MLKFKVPRFTVYQAICERLETVDHITDAIECFHEMKIELAQQIQGKEAKWVLGEDRSHEADDPSVTVLLDFESRCCRKSEDLGDAAMSAQQYDEAVSQYSGALSLHPPTLQVLLAKRSKACAAMGSWQDALNDANEVYLFRPVKDILFN